MVERQLPNLKTPFNHELKTPINIEEAPAAQQFPDHIPAI
jgi:hypothetical protein